MDLSGGKGVAAVALWDRSMPVRLLSPWYFGKLNGKAGLSYKSLTHLLKIHSLPQQSWWLGTECPHTWVCGSISRPPPAVVLALLTDPQLPLQRRPP